MKSILNHDAPTRSRDSRMWIRQLWRNALKVILLLLTSSSIGYALVPITFIQDTVYRADGTPASGRLLITWPAFTTVAGEAVPAGSTSVQIGVNGTVSFSLTPNVGATPAGTYYTAVYHLDDGTVSKEYWVVPNAPTATITGMRSTVMPASVAVQTVSSTYVNAALGNYLPLSGGALQGTLKLQGDPQTPLQAATKEYVDNNLQGVVSSLNQKVAMAPSANQVIQQPPGTNFAVNTLQGKYYASQSQTGTGGNGIANVIGSAPCIFNSPNGNSGCTINVDPTYSNAENPQGYGSYLFGNKTQNMTWPLDTHVHDQRNGVTADYYENPISKVPYQDAGHAITANFTLPYQQWPGYGATALSAEYLQTTDYDGGINFDNYFSGEPEYFFKPYYHNLALATTTYTSGQQEAIQNVLNCHGVGDCLAMSTYVTCDGGWATGNDEGCHNGDSTVTEDPVVYRGIVVGSFPNGTVTLPTSAQQGAGTEGRDRTLLNTLPAKVISGGPFTGYANPSQTGPAGNSAVTPPGVIDSAANWPVSTMVQLCNAASNNGGGVCTAGSQPTGFVPSAPNMIQPASLVTLNVVAPYLVSGYSGLPAGYCSSSNLQSSNSSAACYMPASGVGCLASPEAFETVNYTYNTTNQTVTITNMLYPHTNGMTLATGGLCQYAAEGTSDTSSYDSIKQIFPIIGSVSPTEFYYYSFRPNLGYTPAVLGVSNDINGVNSTSGNFCTTLSLGTFQLQADNKTVAVFGSIPTGLSDYSDFNGLTMTITTPNSSYNGNYVVSYGVIRSGNWISYTLPVTPTGAAPTSGTATFCNLNYRLYPSAQVQSAYDAATSSVDGTLTLMPNTVNWGNNDPVEEAHYPWIYTAFNHGLGAEQWLPRPDLGASLYGLSYNYLLSGQGYGGFTISNNTPQNLYLRYGGTHESPGLGIEVTGDWKNDFAVSQAPDAGDVIDVIGCKPSPIGCNTLSSNFNVLAVPNGGVLNWDPNTKVWTFGNGNNGNPINLTTANYPVVLFGSNQFSYPSISAAGYGLSSSPVANAGFSGQWYAFPANGTNTLDTFLNRAGVDALNCGTGGSDASCTFNAGTIHANTGLSAPTVSATTSVTAATLAVGGGSTVSEIAYYSTSAITPAVVPAQTCSDQTFAVTGLAAIDNLGSIKPPASLGNVSVNGYANAANTVNLHFCNPSAANVTPPAGVYSFLAMH